ncbi:hypothetical protein [Mycobacterium parmense]|uniref:Uncharacterized protein n=1 Tax=Mycobacterium parmense TaxID=185642 RepID=A0A7I7YYK8_9MYCO|nr:hypothetical protein [Mycobacterium parmense]MCV7350532.1 hypothetical protein [Mycobacterium parmense]ORW48252.1 hypothetical protein AWC20_25220 [Mycobacterium parmense]BBZ46043.1 hypothetical protein MPRM_33240 [Mycobacterium parmense]
MRRPPRRGRGAAAALARDAIRAGRLIRSPAMMGALIAMSIFCRAFAARRFFPCTATTYA